VVSSSEYRRAIKAADDLLRWAIKTYPQLSAEKLPQVMSTYVTAAAIFKESGYSWYEEHNDGAFIPRHLFSQKYPMITFAKRNRFLVSRWNGPVTYYAVREEFVKFLGNASYYLPTVDEVRHLASSKGDIPTVTPLLIVNIGDPLVRKILEVHVNGRPTE